jgi:hypothetical protein
LSKYNEHRANAKKRSIPFLLTFDEWVDIWLASGKWGQRGARKGQYVMARFGDKGAYEVGNVKICRAEENRAERNTNYPMKGERNPAFGKNYWLGDTIERRAKISERLSGVPKSDGTRKKMRATATGRRRVYRNGAPTWAHPGDADFPVTH